MRTFICISALSAWASLSMAAAATCPPPATQPNDAKPFHRVVPYNGKFADRLAEIDRRARTEPFAAVAIGDSIVMRWPDGMLQQALGMKTLNAGIGGDIASAVLWRLQNGSWPKDARFVFILVGTNDIWGSQPPCDVFWGIRADVDEVHRIFPQAKVVVSSILPRGIRMSDRDEEIRLTNTALSESAADGGYIFMNAHDAFLCEGKLECDLVVGPNSLHPSDKGYQVLGDILNSTVHAAK